MGTRGQLGATARVDLTVPLAEHDRSLRLVVFALDGQRYAVPIEDVVEVHRMVAVAPLPGASDIVEGVLDLRGHPVPVIDVRPRFGLPGKAIDPGDHLMIARAGARIVALRVDDTLGVVEVPGTEVHTSPAELPGVVHLEGVTHDDEGLILVHDLASLLSLDEGRRLDGALADRTAP